MADGFGFEFDLSRDGGSLDVDAAVDWIRVKVAADELPQLAESFSGIRDSHGNLVVAASDLGFEATNSGAWFDQIYSAFSASLYTVAASRGSRTYTRVLDFCSPKIRGAASTSNPRKIRIPMGLMFHFYRSQVGSSDQGWEAAFRKN
ncbi:hypothetical protein O7608_31130 [Solwaraspora sp. WMMA2056]|uniref:hypothetical protein n=1 Tax=Solwaraspora sp. WMMA2056 TaxID=3015161 RepID=UPI00259BC3C6|nr:hypothetical protein [Solwaraspora sp. WMMA2056]WJK40779.1 hypothetical protein O7608_31130 [Solwaraspora sp. WMMA2056]